MTARTKAEEIALYLGRPWKFNGLPPLSDWRFEIIDGSGRGLFLRVDGKQFKISGSFPTDRTSRYHHGHKTIGVSLARSAKDIAADITRRLLPHYLAAYDAAAAQYQEERRQEHIRMLIVQSVIKVTGGRFCDHSRKVYFDKGEMEVLSDARVMLILRDLSPEQAIKIAAMAAASQREGES